MIALDVAHNLVFIALGCLRVSLLHTLLVVVTCHGAVGVMKAPFCCACKRLSCKILRLANAAKALAVIYRNFMHLSVHTHASGQG